MVNSADAAAADAAASAAPAAPHPHTPASEPPVKGLTLADVPSTALFVGGLTDRMPDGRLIVRATEACLVEAFRSHAPDPSQVSVGQKSTSEWKQTCSLERPGSELSESY